MTDLLQSGNVGSVGRHERREADVHHHQGTVSIEGQADESGVQEDVRKKVWKKSVYNKNRCHSDAHSKCVAVYPTNNLNANDRV